MHGWKNAFDAGEWGLGRMANSLTLGCDCLGEIHYFDATLADRAGRAVGRSTNAICMHEEDYGILWKHDDLQRRHRRGAPQSRRLVVSFIATVGNYEYGFFWYFYLDGNIQLEVKLTGIVSPMAIEPGDAARVRQRRSRPGVAAPHHQHLFYARLDFDVDGTDERRSTRSRPRRVPAGPDNPWGNAFRPTVDAARRRARARSATIERGDEPVRGGSSNPSVRNGLGQPVGYKLVPDDVDADAARRSPSRASASAPASRGTTCGSRRTRADERRAAGEYPNQHAGGDGLPALDRGRPLARRHRRRALVHVRRHPLRAARRTGRSCRSSTPGSCSSPFGFFDRNPALDVPPSTNGHCHSD